MLVCRMLERWHWPVDHFDVIHSHFGPMGLLASALRYSGRSSAALVTTFHGNDISETVDRHGVDYYAPLFSVADRCLGVSRYWAERLVELGAPAERTRVQHMGVDCSRLAFRPAAGHTGQTRLISVGRLTEKKGHEYTLRALAVMRARAPELDVRLDIIGGGPLLLPLTSLRDELGLTSLVRFHDSLTHGEVVERLRSADIFVLPSVTARSGDMEGIPVSLMEAMAQGLPVVSTRHSGIPELVQHDRCGLLVAERDTAGLADSLELLARQPSRWEAMGREGRAIIEQDFDTAQLGRRLRQDYASLVTRAGRRMPSRRALAAATSAPLPMS
jgi:colanic acid/amylovoran biosynthesis glycosyltransferase